MRAIWAFAGALALFASAAMAQEAPPRGVWTTQSGNFDVAIAPCGPAQAQILCGDVVVVHANRSMMDPARAAEAPARVGLRLISDLRPAQGGAWQGKLYNRENGRTYDCLVTPHGAGEIEVRGYVLFPLFGQSQIWRRAAAPRP